MKIIKFIFISGILLTILGGCSDNTIKSRPIYQQTTEMMDLVNQSQWEKANNEAKTMKDLFDKNKWKYQFFGDENEYSGLSQEIAKLQMSIEEQDKKEAKRNIVMIQDYIESIYFR